MTMADSSMTPAVVDNTAPPSDKLTAAEWAKRNLFNSGGNTFITLLFTPIALYLAYRLVRFIFITGRWEAVDSNLELFMIGQYPREERNRIIYQLLIMAGSIGFAVGLMRSAARSVAIETGEKFKPTNWKEYFSSFWSLILFALVLLLAFVDTIGPWLLAGGSLVLAIVGWLLGSQLKGDLRTVGWSLAGVLGAASFQMLSGTGGWAWAFTTVALIPALGVLMRALPKSMGLPLAAIGAIIGVGNLIIRPGIWAVIILGIGLYGLWQAVKGDVLDGGSTGLLMIAGAITVSLMTAINHSGIDWTKWGGFHLNIVVTIGATLLSFPLGIMLAMGRRSSLPMVKYMSVAYIEFFRGAPLITFLLAAQFFLGFFLNSSDPISLVTKVMASITLFSAAYIAEIIRGGLQAVPGGQVEAGQAMGMSQAKIMRLIVLPQALRAVIPAMVGQFISLFKDTTLLGIVSLNELLGVRDLAHAQEQFRGFGIAESLTFVAFGFWAVAYAMSRESQRLERRLGVGTR